MKIKTSSFTVILGLALIGPVSGFAKATSDSTAIRTALAAVATNSEVVQPSKDKKAKKQSYAVEAVLVPGAVITSSDDSITTLEYLELSDEDSHDLGITDSEASAFNENLDVIQGMQEQLQGESDLKIVASKWEAFHNNKLPSLASKTHQKIVRRIARKIN